MKVLIVDDEAPARRELRAQLAQFPWVHVVGEAAEAAEAYELITAIDYDAVFLDVQMPGISGVQLARRLQTREGKPRVIFTTAYPQYALDAFQVGAVDYLLKPFSEERLATALTRLTQPTAQAPSSPPAASLDRIPAEKGSKTLLVQPAEVVCIYARNEEVWVRLRAEEFLCRRYTLRELEERLAPHGFIRTHRRFLVNLNCVREVTSLYKTGMSLIMSDADSTEVPVSRSLMNAVKARLGLGKP